MEPLDRLEALIGRAVEGVFAFGASPGPAELMRAARHALLSGRRTCFGSDLAPNDFTIALAPTTYRAWVSLQAPLEREIAERLAIIAREHGFTMAGQITVRITPDASVLPRGVEARVAITEAPTSYAEIKRLVTPWGWEFTGRRPLTRLVLIETSPDSGESCEHLVAFGNHLVLGSSLSADLVPPDDFSMRLTSLTVGRRLYLTKPARWWRGPYTQTIAAGGGALLAPGLRSYARIRARNGATASAGLISPSWTLTMALGDCLIGRVSEISDVCLADPAISARHARLIVNHDRIEVEDVGSSNGLIVNGVRVSRALLATGHTVRFGRTELSILL